MMVSLEAREKLFSLSIWDGNKLISRAFWWERCFDDLVYEHVNSLSGADRIGNTLMWWWFRGIVFVLSVVLAIVLETAFSFVDQYVFLFWFVFVFELLRLDFGNEVVFGENDVGGDDVLIPYSDLECVIVKKTMFGLNYSVQMVHVNKYGLALKLSPWGFASFYASLHQHFMRTTGRPLDEIRIVEAPLVPTLTHDESVSKQGVEQPSIRKARFSWWRSQFVLWLVGLAVFFFALFSILKSELG